MKAFVGGNGFDPKKRRQIVCVTSLQCKNAVTLEIWYMKKISRLKARKKTNIFP